MHNNHEQMFYEEFGKYMRIAKVNRTTSVQGVMPSDANNKRQLRSVIDLFEILVDKVHCKSWVWYCNINVKVTVLLD